ncbi:acyl carrier protein [Plantactinospora sp. KLBMP9567]|uniref:acyl carrier protein n=1 Tax=Plantactinospora sp. KLBMP9567 TaxID=3085900 RepID=UPI002980F729|nr:acyl carrier protein [Plantactinospora sp. KLBMP9567]MDW5325672.1 acyl carrier protein [Plantactinospora sp. KLBMP9567]
MTTSDLQLQMTSICTEVLNRSTLGPDDDLIELGMDSVAAVEIVTRVETTYGVDVVDVIFDTPTVNRLCDVVSGATRRGKPHAAA